jgi:hypothetical protein
MSDSATIEDRLAAVEQDVALLKGKVLTGDKSRPWYAKLVGSMKDHPEFDEVVRLGREIRKADTP